MIEGKSVVQDTNIQDVDSLVKKVVGVAIILAWQSSYYFNSYYPSHNEIVTDYIRRIDDNLNLTAFKISWRWMLKCPAVLR